MNEHINTYIRFEIAIIGPENAGKSSILRCFMKGDFDEDEPSTAGADFQVYTNVEQKIKLAIWDAAGAEKFDALLPTYFPNKTALLLVIPITMEYKMAETCVNKYISMLKANNSENAKRVLIFSKSDLRDDKSLTDPQLNQLWRLLETDIPYSICSAKNNENIEEVFSVITKKTPSPAENLWLNANTFDETICNKSISESLWTNIDKLDNAICKEILNKLRIEIADKKDWNLNFFGGSRISFIDMDENKTNFKVPNGVARICELLNYFVSHRHPTISYKEALKQIIVIFQSKLNKRKLLRNDNTMHFYCSSFNNIEKQIKDSLCDMRQTNTNGHL